MSIYHYIVLSTKLYNYLETCRHVYKLTCMNKLDIALILGASARLSRLVIVDDAGFYLFRKPAATKIKNTKVREVVLDGLDCPFCIGFWLALLVVTSYFVATKTKTLWIWRILFGSLAANYAAAHLGIALKDFEDV